MSSRAEEAAQGVERLLASLAALQRVQAERVRRMAECVARLELELAVRRRAQDGADR